MGDTAVLGPSAPFPVLRRGARLTERSPRAAVPAGRARGGAEARRGLPGPSAPLSKVEEEASEEGGPEAEAGGHPGCRVAAVVHRSGPCGGEKRKRRDSVKAGGERTHHVVMQTGALSSPYVPIRG